MKKLNFLKGQFKFFGTKLDKSVLYGVLGLLALLIGYPKIKQLIGEWQNKQALKNAIDNAKNGSAQNNPVDPQTTVRINMMRGWATSLNDMSKSTLNKATDMKVILDGLWNKDEVNSLSSYYLSLFGKSLMKDVKAEMSSFWSLTSWNKLSDLVKNNLS